MMIVVSGVICKESLWKESVRMNIVDKPKKCTYVRTEKTGFDDPIEEGYIDDYEAVLRDGSSQTQVI